MGREGNLHVHPWRGRLLVQARRQRSHAQVPSDWVWHVSLPCVAYAMAVLAAVLIVHGRLMALNPVTVSSLVLLFVGIRNAWDAAVYIAARIR
jgi:ABC-type microcin C transport system permease subunit YejB